MLKLVNAKNAPADIPAIGALNERAFPINERRPLGPLLRDNTGHASVLAAYEEDVFCGFACLLEWSDIVHIIYFAVMEELRRKGFGSQILQEIHLANPQKRVIVDIEQPDDSADNNEQRIKRKAFYLRNGYHEDDIHYDWRGIDYAILSHGGAVTQEEFWQFWKNLEREMPGSENY